MGLEKVQSASVDSGFLIYYIEECRHSVYMSWMPNVNSFGAPSQRVRSTFPFARAFKQTVPQAYNLALDLRPTSEFQASSPEYFWYSQREVTPSLLGFETGKGQRSLSRVGSSQAEYLHSYGRRSIYAISLSLNSNWWWYFNLLSRVFGQFAGRGKLCSPRWVYVALLLAAASCRRPGVELECNILMLTPRGWNTYEFGQKIIDQRPGWAPVIEKSEPTILADWIQVAALHCCSTRLPLGPVRWDFREWPRRIDISSLTTGN